VIDIEYRFLSKYALENLLLKIAFQKGVDSSTVEMSLDDKKTMLLHELEHGHARLICDPESGWFDVVPSDAALTARRVDECV